MLWVVMPDQAGITTHDSAPLSPHGSAPCKRDCNRMPIAVRPIVVALLGAGAALLGARLLLRLLAARPDNPVLGVFFALTAPRGPLAALDRGQPRFGAALEFSTLALLIILLALALVIARVSER